MPPQHLITNPIKMVCFDAGGVLLKHCRSWEEGCAAAGLPLRDCSHIPDVTQRRRALSALFTAGKIGSPEFYRCMADAHASVYSAEEIRRIHLAWLLDEYPGVSDLLDRLAAVPGVQTGILSNTNHDHWVHIEAAGAGARYSAPLKVKHRYASHVLGLAKPHADIYREFERRTGFAGPDILFFDDLEENVAAARALDWHAERIDHTGDTALQIEGHLRVYGVL